MHEEGTRLMTQGPTYRYSKLTSGSSKGCQRENEHMSVQPEPSRTRSLLPSLADTDARKSYGFKALNSSYSPYDVDCPACLYTSCQN